MDETSSGAIDEGALTKGQLRKLNALRKKCRGRDRGAGVRRVAGLAGRFGGAGRRERGNDRRHPVAPGSGGHAGDSARRLPDQAGPRQDHSRDSTAVECLGFRRVRPPSSYGKVLADADPSGARESVFLSPVRLPRACWRRPRASRVGTLHNHRAVGGVTAPGHAPGIYHDVSEAMGEASETISTSSGPSFANARQAATSAGLW